MFLPCLSVCPPKKSGGDVSCGTDVPWSFSALVLWNGRCCGLVVSHPFFTTGELASWILQTNMGAEFHTSASTTKKGGLSWKAEETLQFCSPVLFGRADVQVEPGTIWLDPPGMRWNLLDRSCYVNVQVCFVQWGCKQLLAMLCIPSPLIVHI